MKNAPFATRMRYALTGLGSAWQQEKSLRTHSLAAVAVVPVMLWLQPALLWWALVGVMITLVLAAELFNTALEHLADHLHPDHHPQVAWIKDCAAGAVLVLSFGALWVAFLMVLSVI